MPLRLSRALLYFFLAYPSAAYYLSLLSGVPIPYLADVILVGVLAVFAISELTRKIRFGFFDWIFGLYFASTFGFLALNVFNLPALMRIAEIRYIVLIPLVYFLFRFGLGKSGPALDINRVVYRILLLHCIWIPIEFVILNYALPGVLPDRAAALYPERDRVYEVIVQFWKPLGLFPGTGNAAIAASFLFLICINQIRLNRFHFILATIAVALTFTLTSGILILLGYGLLTATSERRVVVRLFSIALTMLLLAAAIYYQLEITLLRGQGEYYEPIVEAGFENLQFYYVSIEESFARMGWLPHVFVTPDIHEAVGTGISEIYLLRVGVYFGYLTLLMLMILLLATAMNVFFSKSREQKILFVLSFLVLFASFHYPSINGVPLYIFLPLFLWRAVTMEKPSRYFVSKDPALEGAF